MPKFSIDKTETLARAVGLSRGGVAELSSWGGKGATWTRSELRTDAAGLVPETVEGLWYVAAAVRAMASGHLKFGYDDPGLKKAAKQLSKQIDKVIDLYDS